MSEAVVNLKPMLKVEDMVEYLKKKNITFNHISEEEATKYLKHNNNYYNVTSYRNNFKKYTSGENTGKFLDLDFAYLKDMAIIDMHLRKLLLSIILDIEHYLKIQVLNEIEYIYEEDGYKIVNKFLQEDFDNGKRIHNKIWEKVETDLSFKVLDDYNIERDTLISNIPIWVFLEVITMGDLKSFYEFYSKEYNLTENIKNIHIVRGVNRLRNAVAHNTCILSDLNETGNNHRIDIKIIDFLNKCKISKFVREQKMSNERIRQLVYTLYAFDNIVSSEGVKKYTYKQLDDFFYNRVYHHSEYYQNNHYLKSVCDFFDKIVLVFIKNSN